MRKVRNATPPKKNWLKSNYLLAIVVVGNKVEKLCDLCNITVNKNAVFGDSSALSPGGVRIGKNCYMDFIIHCGH